MDELVFKIGEMLDKKLEEIFDRKLEEKLDRILDRKLEEKLDKILDEKFEKVKKEIMDRQFLFEENYGTKIDAILDAVTLELDKNLEKSEKIRKIDDRMDRAEVNIFGLEKRVSNLELNKSK